MTRLLAAPSRMPGALPRWCTEPSPSWSHWPGAPTPHCAARSPGCP